MEDEDLKDVKELKGVMEVLSDTVPALLESITKVLYDQEEGEKMGQAVASFYSALIKSGMSSEQAYALTKEYMSSMSLGSMIQGFMKGHREEDDISKMVKEKIRKEMEREMEELGHEPR
ncbi:MAG: hypothetical protein ACLFUV_04875 [Methanomassiliicoccales archaeon]